MDRPGKEALVASLHRTFNETAVVVVTHYSGLTVAEMSDLRAQMRQVGASFKVCKNRLVRLALADTPYHGLETLFKGPTAMVCSHDPVGAAKVSTTFAKANAKLIILGGGLGSQPIDAEGIKALAALPSLDELRGRFIGLLNAPAARLVQITQAPAAQLVRLTQAYGEKAA